MQRERVYDVLREALELLLHEPQQVLSIHCLSRWHGSKMIQNGSRNDMIVDCLNFNADCRSCSAFSGRSFWYLSLDSFDRRHSTLTAPTNEYFAYIRWHWICSIQKTRLRQDTMLMNWLGENMHESSLCSWLYWACCLITLHNVCKPTKPYEHWHSVRCCIVRSCAIVGHAASPLHRDRTFELEVLQSLHLGNAVRSWDLWSLFLMALDDMQQRNVIITSFFGLWSF